MEIACDSVFDLILYTLRNNNDRLLLRSAVCLLISLVVDNSKCQILKIRIRLLIYSDLYNFGFTVGS